MGPRLQSRQAARLPGGTEFRLRQLAHAGRRAADRGAADAGADAARPGRHRAGRCRLPGFLPAAGAPRHAARAPRRPAQLRPAPANDGGQRRKKGGDEAIPDTIPSSRVLTTSSSEAVMNGVTSLGYTTCSPAGRYGASSFIFARIALAVCSALAPGAAWMARTVPGRPLYLLVTV